MIARPTYGHAQRELANPPSTPTKSKPKPLSIPNNVKGKDLFDAQLWKDPTSTSVFYAFIASLRRKINQDVKKTTSTHRFIKTLRDTRKLIRCYTQNIDGLEAREGLNTDMSHGKGNRSRFTKKALDGQRSPARTQPGADLDGGCEVVQLHGDLRFLRCTLCQQIGEWEDRHSTRLLAGKAPSCQQCAAANQDRQDRGKRGTKIGTLRPNVVLYGEEHPCAEAVGEITASDLTMSPDVLLILGTSLHVHGLKTMVREFAKAVHAKAGGKGRVIFVNLSRPSESVWKGVLDCWVSMDCDAWVDSMRRHRPDIFQIQPALKVQVKKTPEKMTPKTIANGIVADRSSDDKENFSTGFSSNLQKPTQKQPRVIVTPKKQNKHPLIDKTTPMAKRPHHIPLSATARTPANPTLQLLHQLEAASSSTSTSTAVVVTASSSQQLPTPPLTSHRQKTNSNSNSTTTTTAKNNNNDKTSNKRSLAQTYQDLCCDTPSKKQKRKGGWGWASQVDIWQDWDE